MELLLCLMLGLSIGLFFFFSNQMVRETVEAVGIDRSAESITSNKFFQYLLPFVQIMSFYIAKLPIEYPDEAMGLADDSLRRASLWRRTKRLNGIIHLRLRRWLVQAGKIDVFSPDDMLGTCVVSTGIWALTGWYFVSMDVTGNWLIYVAAVFGIIFPLMSLKSFIVGRQRKLIRGLPFSIDLLALSMEAGLDFTTALQRICDRQRGTPIADEFGEMLRQIKMGQTRREGLRDMAARLDLDDVTSFCNSLIQADELGTPIGQVLTVQSEQMRIKRFQRAEELAGKAPVKILFPLVVFIMPTVFIVLFGPIFLAAKDAQ